MHIYIHIVGLQLPSYGLLIATGVVIANFVSYLILRKTKQDGNDFIILEGDYTNVDIPYFEGMQSVKMPLLTTTGKNLLNSEWEIGGLSFTDG